MLVGCCWGKKWWICSYVYQETFLEILTLLASLVSIQRGACVPLEDVRLLSEISSLGADEQYITRSV
jgi:hypothetical protein